MSPQNRKKLIEGSRQEWRKLGFYVDLDGEQNYRIITGSYNGLLQFCRILYDFSENSNYAHHTASAHYGPYANLRLMTHDQCGVDQINIYGTRQDFKRLSRLVEDELSSALPGDQIIIHEQYNPRSRFSLVLRVCEEGFDPASLDPEKWAQ